MGDVTLIGLGFQGDANNRFQSVNPNLGAGSSNFFACVLVNLQESLLVAPTNVSYFGNFNAELPPGTRGWELARIADTPASDPPNTPEILTLITRFGHGGLATTLSWSADAPSMFGRTHLLGLHISGLVATLYVNGAAVAQDTFVGAFNLGNSGLTYGNIAGGGFRSGDPVISAAYSEIDAANFVANQRALFEGIRTSGKLAGTIATLGLSAEYIYESFQQKAPISGLPTTQLKNFGTLGVNGNLTFFGSAALVVNADPDPDYTGGAQSASFGPGGVNLQDAYDSGPTGLIATDGGIGPVGVDELRMESGELSVATGDLSLTTPASATASATSVLIDAGDGGVVAPNGFNGGSIFANAGAGGAATAGGTGGNGGQIIVRTGDGGDAAGAGATGGNGGELNLEAGAAGVGSGGAADGIGGELTLSAGTSTAGLGGTARLRSGNGLQSGDLFVTVGTSEGIPGTLNIIGGTAIGLTSLGGGQINIAGGPAAVGTGQDGGIVSVLGGDGDGAAGTGGRVEIAGGSTGVGGGPGGAVSLRGGIGGGGALDNGGAGGDAVVAGGSASQPNQPGGDLQLLGGQAAGAGAFGGNVVLQSGAVAGAAAGSGNVTINSGLGTGVGNTAGSVELALNAGTGNAGAVVGGFFLDPTDGRLTLRNFTPAADPTGSLRLHNLNTAGEALQTADDGVLHFRTEQAAGDDVTVGYRAAKSGNYGLMGRVFARTFDDGDLVADALTTSHNLDANGVGVFVYDNTGALQTFGIAGQGVASVQETSADVAVVTLDAAVTPIAGTWRVLFIGY